jgi:hypothetical protein
LTVIVYYPLFDCQEVDSVWNAEVKSDIEEYNYY